MWKPRSAFFINPPNHTRNFDALLPPKPNEENMPLGTAARELSLSSVSPVSSISSMLSKRICSSPLFTLIRMSLLPTPRLSLPLLRLSLDLADADVVDREVAADDMCEVAPWLDPWPPSFTIFAFVLVYLHNNVVSQW